MLKVTAAPTTRRPTVAARTVLVRKARTDASSVRATARCDLRGQRLPRRLAQRLCHLTVTVPDTSATAVTRKRVRITAAPVCNTRLRLHATVTAKKPGATRTTWTRTWRLDTTPRVPCRIRATG